MSWLSAYWFHGRGVSPGPGAPCRPLLLRANPDKIGQISHDYTPRRATPPLTRVFLSTLRIDCVNSLPTLMVGFVFSVFNGATKSPVSNSHVINYSLIWMNQNFHYVCLKNFIIFTFFRGRNCSSRGKIYLCSISLYDIYLYYIKKYKDIRKNRSCRLH